MTGNDEEEEVRKGMGVGGQTHRKETEVDMQYMSREGGQTIHSCYKLEIV